jgi:hypothetical protein
MRLTNEDDLVEIRWARQDSYVHAEDITPQPPGSGCIVRVGGALRSQGEVFAGPILRF